MRTKQEIMSNKRIVWESCSDDDMAGIIILKVWKGSIIASTGAGWEHVSVCPLKKSYVPSWDDMCLIKDIFWKEDEAVIQIHPPKEEYVNNLSNCLHLWRCTYKEMVLPPSILVGIKKGMNPSEIDKALKEAYEIAGEKYE